MSTRQAALHHDRSLYRRSLKLALDWAVHRHLWRGQALYIRSLFEANRSVTDSRQKRELLAQTEKLLSKWKHPEPYVHPTAPGGMSRFLSHTPQHFTNSADDADNDCTGSKFERNLRAPILDPPPPLKF
ncbi:complex 1 protein [Colletotrichum acutatum]